MVFVGSENAGQNLTTISSVGRSVADDEAYDVVILRAGVGGRLTHRYIQ